MVNTVPRNLKEIHNYPAEGKVTNTERNHGLSGRFPDTVNVNIGPVLILARIIVIKDHTSKQWYSTTIM